MEEICFTECPECGKEVKYLWDGGVIPTEQYVLIVDSIYHTKCWEKLVDEHPTEG
jgi:uncharacterized protein YuzB (UPF0349 family)